MYAGHVVIQERGTFITPSYICLSAPDKEEVFISLRTWDFEPFASRRYERSSNDSDRSVWVDAQKAMHKMFEGEYCRRKVDDSRGNWKIFWQTLAGISNSSTSVSTKHTADFARFFCKKVKDIRAEMSSAKSPNINNNRLIFSSIH